MVPVSYPNKPAFCPTAGINSQARTGRDKVNSGLLLGPFAASGCANAHWTKATSSSIAAAKRVCLRHGVLIVLSLLHWEDRVRNLQTSDHSVENRRKF